MHVSTADSSINLARAAHCGGNTAHSRTEPRRIISNNTVNLDTEWSADLAKGGYPC